MKLIAKILGLIIGTILYPFFWLLECYKFYLCCRIADLVISDIEPKEKEESK